MRMGALCISAGTADAGAIEISCGVPLDVKAVSIQMGLERIVSNKRAKIRFIRDSEFLFILGRASQKSVQNWSKSGTTPLGRWRHAEEQADGVSDKRGRGSDYCHFESATTDATNSHPRFICADGEQGQHGDNEREPDGGCYGKEDERKKGNERADNGGKPNDERGAWCAIFFHRCQLELFRHHHIHPHLRVACDGFNHRLEQRAIQALFLINLANLVAFERGDTLNVAVFAPLFALI